MNHYTCTGGCDTESDTPGVCRDGDCLKQGQPFTACDCTDGHHGMEDEEERSGVRKRPASSYLFYW
jgi:hypothetical protein